EPCDPCMQELWEWQEVVGAIPLGVIPDGPSAAVKERLMKQIRRDRQAHVAKVMPLQPRRWRSAWVTLPLAAAAAGLIAIGGLRYHEAIQVATEQSIRAETVAILLRQEQEKLTSRDDEVRRLNTAFAEQQVLATEKSQNIAQLESALAEQRQLVASRE